MVLRCLLLLALIVSALTAPLSAQVPFEIETVDSDGRAGVSASLALDSEADSFHRSFLVADRSASAPMRS